MNAPAGVGCLLEGDVWGDQSLARPAYQDVCRVDAVRHRGTHPVVVVAELDGDVDRLLGVGDEEDVLEGFPGVLRLVGGEPLLEKRREGVPVDDLVAGLVSDGDLAVSLERELCQMLSPAIPSGE